MELIDPMVKNTLVYGAKLFYLYKLDKTTETIRISPKSFGEVKLKINKKSILYN
jgi:hypothetical protein